MICSFCNGPLLFGKVTCSKCGMICTSNSPGGSVKEEDFVDAFDVDAMAVERIVTGLAPCDECWGGGFVPTSITLLGGAPGAGKTTLLLQLSILFAQITKKPTYYISAEQDKGELKMTLNRFGMNLERGQLRVLNKMGAGGEIDITVFKKVPPGMIILDSVSALCGKDKELQIAVCKRYKQYAVEHKAPVFLIAHMTKEHDFAGMMALQHEVDTLATLFPDDGDNPEHHGRREMQAWKNRNGPTHKIFYLVMTAAGLVALPPEPEKKKRASRDLEEDDLEEDDLEEEDLEEERPRSRGKVKPPAEKISVDGQELVLMKKTSSKSMKLPVRAPFRPLPPEPPTAAQRAKAAKAKKARGKPRVASKEASKASKGTKGLFPRVVGKSPGESGKSRSR